MRNNNGASIRRLSARSLQNNRMRNVFAILAITLTGILFTAVFSLTSGAMQAAEEEIMREVGGRFHAGLKTATMKQYEEIAADPLVKASGYTILIGMADNLIKRQAEIRYTPDESMLYDMFITLEEGRMPEAKNEIIVDTFVLDELGLPCELGTRVPLRFPFMGEMVEEEFVVCGFYRGDAIAHASELFVSEDYWTDLKGSYTDEDFLRWTEEHPEYCGAGLLAGDFYFENAKNVEGKIRTVIQNAGYEPGTELAYGVNWAYMGSRMEALDPMTMIILFGAVFVILLTGYLIIYNIFQISVVSDIRFYGLLKTIGTTKGQIRRLVRRQAFLLSAAGIPIGLLAGFGIGKLLLPFLLDFGDSYRGMEVSLEFNPWILVFSAGFSAFTVWLSSGKPGRIAGSVSPIEAVRYAEMGGKGKTTGRKKKKRQGNRGRFDALSMALANLGRNRRTTAVVISAISLSIILLTMVMTAVGSFRLDEYLEQRIVGDYVLGNIGTISSAARSGDVRIAPEFLAMAEAQEGIWGKTEMWIRYRSFLQLDGNAMERLQDLDDQGKLRRDTFSVDELEEMLRGERDFDGNFYAYSEELLSNLEVLDGTFDMERFKTGDYVLLTQILGSDTLEAEEHIYHPGDKVTVKSYGENSISHEIRDASGATVGFTYENLEEKEYEVMAIVGIPYSMDTHRYTANGCDVVLPLTEFDTEDEYTYLFAASYLVAEENKEAFRAALEAYTENNPEMAYTSKETLEDEFEGMVGIMATFGITLSAVIALIGILNFTNAMITEVISRKREFAMLQSIGMTGDQLLTTLVFEGISYVVISGMISLVLGSLLSRIILGAINNVILFFEYRFQVLPFVIIMPVLVLSAVAVPVFAYQSLRKRSIVERLRESE